MCWRSVKNRSSMRLQLLLVVGLQVIQWLDFGLALPAVHMQVEENRISLYNDSDYVAEIMRMAKSAEMRNFMNPEAEVCDNFYEYACGNWPRLHPAETSAKRITSIFDLLGSSYKQKQLRLLNADRANEMVLLQESEEELEGGDTTNADAVKKVKDFYKSCRKMTGVKKAKVVEEMHEIIREFGTMPALLQPGAVWQEEDDFDCFKMLGSIQHRYGFDIILRLGLRADFGNKSLHTLFVGQPALKLGSKSVYKGLATKRLRDDYQVGIQENLEDFLGLSEEMAEIVSKGILDFEMQLAEGLSDFHMDEALKSESIRRAPQELETLYGDNMNFLTFLETTLGYPLNVTCYEYTPGYHGVLKEVLHKTPKAQVANYIMYQLVEPFFMGYDRPYTDLEDVCLERTKKFFLHLLDNTIYKTYDTVALQTDILTIWHEIKQTFRQQMNTSKMEWLTENTRKLALEKLERLQLHINSYESRNFSLEYAEVTTNPDNYMANLKQLNNLRVIKFLQKLSRPGKMEYVSHELIHLPAFINSENVIIIPVSLLQPNYLWSQHYPQALKFGTLGFLLAHELIHGFDDIGKHQHHHHNNNNNDTDLAIWWDEPSFKAFKRKKACFKSQYAHFRYNGKYLPVSDMQAENIADNAAVQLAYKSYMRWLNLQALETLDELLPNMQMNNKKLFFLSFAQFQCVDVDDVMKDKISLLDVHAPAKYRVIGPLANFPEFAKIFKCSQGSTMNPDMRCEIY